jgi:hypothetical protein
LFAICRSALSTIIGRSFVAPAAARLACMVVACAGLVLLTPPASRQLDAATAPALVESATPADSTRDRTWSHDVDGSASDACDDDDDGDDESTATPGPVTADCACRAPEFSDSADVSVVTENRRRSRGRDVHLLRGPPAAPMESSDSVDDDSARPHASTSDCGATRRELHRPSPCNPFHSASTRSDDRLRAPP